MISLRTKNKMTDRHEIVSRNRKKFQIEDYKQRVSRIEWGDFYESNDLEYINNKFEEEISKILNEVAPIKITQKRKNYRKWVNTEVKNEMKIRDRNREVARASQRMEDWEKYRRSRNKCVKLLEK